MWVSYSVNDVINRDNETFWRRIGVANRATLWELTGPIDPAGTLYTLDEIREEIPKCTEIPYEQTPTSGIQQKKRVNTGHERYIPKGK